eukprot:8935214-Pyramimonas_sp.AAC.1
MSFMRRSSSRWNSGLSSPSCSARASLLAVDERRHFVICREEEGEVVSGLGVGDELKLTPPFPGHRARLNPFEEGCCNEANVYRAGVLSRSIVRRPCARAVGTRASHVEGLHGVVHQVACDAAPLEMKGAE